MAAAHRHGDPTDPVRCRGLSPALDGLVLCADLLRRHAAYVSAGGKRAESGLPALLPDHCLDVLGAQFVRRGVDLSRCRSEYS